MRRRSILSSCDDSLTQRRFQLRVELEELSSVEGEELEDPFHEVSLADSSELGCQG